MVVLDASVLIFFFQPDAGAPEDASGNPVEKPQDRVKYLIEELQSRKEKIVVPTPALSEILIHAGAAKSQAIIEMLNKKAVFRIEPFDQRAAIELAAMSRTRTKKKLKAGPETWAKVKFDRQIVAMAKVADANTIYSDDEGLAKAAKYSKIPVVGICDLPLPPIHPQVEIPLYGAPDE